MLISTDCVIIHELFSSGGAISAKELSGFSLPKAILDSPAGSAYCVSNLDNLKFTFMLVMILLAIKSRSCIDHQNLFPHFL